MLRLQPADFEPSGWPGMAGRQRMGRYFTRADGRNDAQATVGRPPGLGRANHHGIAADRNGRDVTSGQPPPETELAGPTHGHTS